MSYHKVIFIAFTLLFIGCLICSASKESEIAYSIMTSGLARFTQPLASNGQTVSAQVNSTPLNTSLSNIVATTEVSDDEFWGVGANQIVQFNAYGYMLKSAAIPLSHEAGLTPYADGTILVGSPEDNSVYRFYPGNNSTQKLLDLSVLDTTGFSAGDVICGGKLAGLAWDGVNVYAGIKAGFSSSIFKIDPNTGNVISQTWAPGANPSAMAYSIDTGSLFVLDGISNQLRGFDRDMNLLAQGLSVPDKNPKGIFAEGTGIRVLSVSGDNMNLQIHPIYVGNLLASKPVSIVNSITSSVANSVVNSVANSVAGNDANRIADKAWTASNTSVATTAFKPAHSGKKVAVLICGDVAESGFECFWSDTCWLYKSLRDAGYSPENIYVLYGNGVDHRSDNPFYQSTEKITDFPATIEWVDAVFDGLMKGDTANGISKMSSYDTLLVWTFGHGAGGNQAYLGLMDGWMDENRFASKFCAVPFQMAAVFMQQSRGGGFIDSLQGPRTFIFTACGPDQDAYPTDTENEIYNGRVYDHGEFDYYVISAIAGMTPVGKTAGVKANAGANGGSGTSALDVYNWEASHEGLDEVPQMSDVGSIGGMFMIRSPS